MAKKSSFHPTPEDGRSLFDTVMSFSEHPWHPLPSGVWSQHTVEPSRELLIESTMAISVTVCEKGINKRGESEPHYPTREEAEAEVDRWLALTQPQAVA